jgi:hypothetical protein
MISPLAAQQVRTVSTILNDLLDRLNDAAAASLSSRYQRTIAGRGRRSAIRELVETRSAARRARPTRSRRTRAIRSEPRFERRPSFARAPKDSHAPKSPIAAAIRYADNQWDQLGVFLDDDSVPLDNNGSERALRRSRWVGRTISSSTMVTPA